MWNFIGNASAFASLLGVGVMSFFDDATKSHVAFAAFGLALVLLVWRAVAALSAWQKRTYPKGYVPIATFIRYRTGDGLHYFYETFRHIQIKTAFKNSFEHSFFWTGTKKPVLKSSLQTVGDLKENQGGQNSIVPLKFRQYRTYNDTEIVHIEMQLDDSDRASKPFLCAKVDNPMQFIHFRVELLHYKPAQFGSTATLEKKLISANELSEFSLIEQVPFDGATKSFECLVPHPEPGYQYRLRWERDSNQGNAKRK